MFTQARNIDTAFKHIRAFSIITIAGSIALSCFALFKSYQLVAKVQSRVYILANGKALEAFAAERKDNIGVEARDHIAVFHHYFFTLDPDEKVIAAHLTRALYLADGSAKRAYDNLKENGYYTGLVAGNMSQQLEIDSIWVDINQYPFYFRCTATEQLIRATSVVTRSLLTEGYLRNVARSDNNSHGFLIERWVVLENKDLKTTPR